MDITELTRTVLAELSACLDAVDPQRVARAAEALCAVRDADGTVFLAGNGGSAATASHIASDLCHAPAGRAGPRVPRTLRDNATARGLRAICLTDNVAALTASANDTSYEDALAELVARQARPGDALVVLSGSGSSPNMVRAARVARRMGLVVVGLVGWGGGELAAEVDHLLVSEARHYGAVESLHLALGHVLSMYLCGPDRAANPDQRPGSAIPED